MLKIRFQRTGRRNDPAFRIVVAEHTASPRAGRNVAVVGSHHPKTKQTSIDAEAVQHWLSHGAKASGTVHNLLVSQGIIKGEKVNVLPKKTPIVKEEVEEEQDPSDATESESSEADEGAADTSSEEASTPAAEEEKTEEAAPEDDQPSEEAEKTAS
ncbi:MAG: 30S ribosomal protein S16 [Patescibacteria group bacterium UBA2163]